MAKYSTTTDAKFMPKFKSIATSADAPSIIDIKKGPASLQIKPIRRICALRSQSTGLFRSAITTTQSFSTDTKFITEASFSMHAKTVSMVKSPHCKPRGIDHPLARNQNATQDAATANRCETIDCLTTVSRLPVSIYRPTAGD